MSQIRKGGGGTVFYSTPRNLNDIKLGAILYALDEITILNWINLLNLFCKIFNVNFLQKGGQFMSNPVVPMQKVGGSCPNGYSTQGNMCVPGSSAKPAIIKVGGSCPNGWSTQGGYCVASSSNPKHVMHKAGGSCPNGYSTQGSYCVKS